MINLSNYLPTPINAKILNFGILLSGKGQVWLDNVNLEEVDKSTPTTDFVAEEIYPDCIMNREFEEV